VLVPTWRRTLCTPQHLLPLMLPWMRRAQRQQLSSSALRSASKWCVLLTSRPGTARSPAHYVACFAAHAARTFIPAEARKQLVV